MSRPRNLIAQHRAPQSPRGGECQGDKQTGPHARPWPHTPDPLLYLFLFGRGQNAQWGQEPREAQGLSQFPSPSASEEACQAFQVRNEPTDNTHPSPTATPASQEPRGPAAATFQRQGLPGQHRTPPPWQAPPRGGAAWQDCHAGMWSCVYVHVLA